MVLIILWIIAGMIFSILSAVSIIKSEIKYVIFGWIPIFIVWLIGIIF